MAPLGFYELIVITESWMERDVCKTWWELFVIEHCMAAIDKYCKKKRWELM